MVAWLIIAVMLCSPGLSSASVGEAAGLRARYFPAGAEGVRLVHETGRERYYVLITGGNPLGDSTQAVARRLNLRAKSRLLRQLAGESAPEKMLELKGWETVGIWEEGDIFCLVSRVDKENVRILERSDGNSAGESSGKAAGGERATNKSAGAMLHAPVEHVSIQPDPAGQIAGLKKLLASSDKKMAIWVEIRELCRIQGDVDGFDEAVNAIMDLKMQ